jgi:hypothetical protein
MATRKVLHQKLMRKLVDMKLMVMISHEIIKPMVIRQKLCRLWQSKYLLAVHPRVIDSPFGIW